MIAAVRLTLDSTALIGTGVGTLGAAVNHDWIFTTIGLTIALLWAFRIHGDLHR